MEARPTRLSSSAWEAAIGAAPIQHAWTYGAVAADFGTEPLRYELWSRGARIGLSQCLMRRTRLGAVVLMPRPPVWDRAPREGLVDAIRHVLPARAPRLFLAPTGQGAPVLPLSRGREEASLDLKPDPDTLRARLHGKWRNRLVRAEREGLVCRAVSGIPEWLIAREAAQRRAKGYAGLPPAWLRAWSRHGAILTLVAGADGAEIAGMAFLVHGRAATYQVGWSSEEGRRRSAHNLLFWNACIHLRAAGVERLDLGRIARRHAPGLARFKLGTGAAIDRAPPIGLALPHARLTSRLAGGFLFPDGVK